MDERIIKAARGYLELRGYNIVDSIGDNMLVCFDENRNEYVFASVHTVALETYFKSGHEIKKLSRKEAEEIMFGYMAEKGKVNCTMRYDSINIAVATEDKAFLIHAKGVLDV